MNMNSLKGLSSTCLEITNEFPYTANVLSAEITDECLQAKSKDN